MRIGAAVPTQLSLHIEPHRCIRARKRNNSLIDFVGSVVAGLVQLATCSPCVATAVVGSPHGVKQRLRTRWLGKAFPGRWRDALIGMKGFQTVRADNIADPRIKQQQVAQVGGRHQRCSTIASRLHVRCA